MYYNSKIFYQIKFLFVKLCRKNCFRKHFLFVCLFHRFEIFQDKILIKLFKLFQCFIVSKTAQQRNSVSTYLVCREYQLINLMQLHLIQTRNVWWSEIYIFSPSKRNYFLRRKNRNSIQSKMNLKGPKDTNTNKEKNKKRLIEFCTAKKECI